MKKHKRTQELKRDIEKNPNYKVLKRVSEDFTAVIIELAEKSKADLVDANTIKDTSVRTETAKSRLHNKLIVFNESGSFPLVSSGYGNKGQPKYEVGSIPGSGIARQGDYRFIASISCKVEIDQNTDVHHIDGNHFNNDPYNLLILPKMIHIMYHSREHEKINNLVEDIIKTTGKGKYKK